MAKHLHLDVTGGIAGDMFLSAMLSACPELRGAMLDDLRAAGVLEHVTLSIDTVREKGFAAVRVKVTTASDAPPTSQWRDIRAFIDGSGLDAPVKARALAIFALLAEAEATCHGVAPDEVHFHEIADWDSLADIIGAASVIDRAGVEGWSVSALPVGSGRVKTRHGIVPVPAPATAELLIGFEMFTDAGQGERITPTGAAILRHLAPVQHLVGPRGRLSATGTGAGQRQMEGIANILRVLVFEDGTRAPETVSLIRFEVDDMTPEEIAVSLDRLRLTDGVLDAGYATAFGKKGRAQFAVTITVRTDATAALIEACFAETSTIGLRVQTVARHVLPRRADVGLTRTKTVERPEGVTRKAESDDLTGVPTLQARRNLARAAEAEHD